VMFQDLFHNTIASLLNSFPEDQKTESGQLFWSGPKRCPMVLKFDPNDQAYADFIYAAANLFAYTFGVEPITNKEDAAKLASEMAVPEFQPKKITVNESTNQIQEVSGDDDDLIIQDLTEKLSTRKPLEPEAKKLNETEFEKDSDTNFHIDFIAGVSNLRARNYKIEEVDKFKIKFIAGKIIPAIATTTAMIVGVIGFEIIKFILQKPVSVMKNSFCNLALPLWVFSVPLPAVKFVDYNPPKGKSEYAKDYIAPYRVIPRGGFTNWDKIVLEGPMSLGEIVIYFKDKYEVEVGGVAFEKALLYNKYTAGDKQKRLKMTPDECYEDIMEKVYLKHKKFMQIVVTGETQDGFDFESPKIIYMRK